MYKIKLLDGKEFTCLENETLLEGALRNGLFLEHSCLSGRCSSCKFKVKSGSTVADREELSLTNTDEKAGYILTCVRKPTSDIVLDAEDLSAYGLSKSRTIPSKIQSIEKLTEDIIRVILKVPLGQKPSFLEGQYLNVIRKGIKRSYSIASRANEPNIELIIKNYSGGQMSAYWFEEAKENDLLRLEIPKGTFFLRDYESTDTVIFLATGTGIAPIKSILENIDNQKKLQHVKRVILLWGMKYENDIFWKPNVKFVEFIPVLSRENSSKRYIQHILKEIEGDFSKTSIYACGSDAMIQEAKSIAISKGLSPSRFYSDAFVPSN